MSEPRLRLPLVRHRMGGADFARAYELGRRAQGAGLTVVVHENGTERTRIGLSVGKRVDKRAVRRNRVRRRYREAFRLSLPELPAGIDVILIGTPGAVELPMPALRRELLELVARALKKKPRRPRGEAAS